MFSDSAIRPPFGGHAPHNPGHPNRPINPQGGEPAWLSPIDLITAVTDPATSVVLTDENGCASTRWGMGNGLSITRLKEAYDERARCVLPGDRGYRLDANSVVLVVGSNGSLPDELLVGATYRDVFDDTLHTIDPLSLTAVRRGVFGDEHPLHWHLAACDRWTRAYRHGNEVTFG